MEWGRIRRSGETFGEVGNSHSLFLDEPTLNVMPNEGNKDTISLSSKTRTLRGASPLLLGPMSNTNAFGSSAFRQKETVSLVSLTHWPKNLDAPGLCASKKRLRKPPPTSCDLCTNVFIYHFLLRHKRNLALDRVEPRWPISDQFAGLIKIRGQKFAIFVPLSLLPKVTDLCGIGSVQTIWTY